MPTVSIALATYNGERFIREQLESLANQTMIPDQIVISDDNSTDRTMEIIDEWIDSCQGINCEINVIKNNRESGVCGNFENSLLHTTGDFIFFCDQDDIWMPDKVETTVNLMKEYNSSVAYCNAQIIVEDETHNFKPTNKYLFIDTKNQIEFMSFDFKDIAENCYIQGMCLCCKKEFIKSLLPLSKGSNHDNWIEAVSVLENRPLRIPKVMAFYRIHSNNTCGIQGYKRKNCEYYLKKLPEINITTLKHVKQMMIWWHDLSGVVDNSKHPTSDFVKFKQLAGFYTDQRIRNLSGGKLKATYSFLKFYKLGISKNYSSQILLRDLIFIWSQNWKFRKKAMAKLQEDLNYRNG